MLILNNEDIKMRLIVFEMPTKHDERCKWLDGILMSDELSQLVVELNTIYQNEITAVTAEELLGEELNQFLSHGFIAISNINISTILQNPKMLHELKTLRRASHSLSSK
jgi:hypothetical protein